MKKNALMWFVFGAALAANATTLDATATPTATTPTAAAATPSDANATPTATTPTAAAATPSDANATPSDANATLSDANAAEGGGVRTAEAIVAGSEGLSGAALNAYAGAITSDEARGVLEWLLEDVAARGAEHASALAASVPATWIYRKATAAVRAEYDLKLSEAGVAISPDFYNIFPLCGEVWFSSAANAAAVRARPVWAAAVRARRSGWVRGWPFALRANAIAEKLAVERRTLEDVAALKRELAAGASRVVVQRLRARGETFDPGAGENPVKAAVAALFAALDAPNFAGLGAWVGTWCEGAAWVEPAWPAADEIAALERGVLEGTLDFGPVTQGRLFVALGLEGYNAFVERFNGDGD